MGTIQSLQKMPPCKRFQMILASLGISLDPDTVRKWIKEAAEILPRDIT